MVIDNIVNYYKNFDFKYPEKAVCLVDVNRHNPGTVPFHIKAVMPLIPQGRPNTRTERTSNSHVLNQSRPRVGSFQSCNFVEIELPSWMTASIKDIDVKSTQHPDTNPSMMVYNGMVPEYQDIPAEIDNEERRRFFIDDGGWEDPTINSNEEYIVVFIGGSLQNRKIIGRW